MRQSLIVAKGNVKHLTHVLIQVRGALLTNNRLLKVEQISRKALLFKLVTSIRSLNTALFRCWRR